MATIEQAHEKVFETTKEDTARQMSLKDEANLYIVSDESCVIVKIFWRGVEFAPVAFPFDREREA